MDEKNLADFHQLQKSPELLFPYVWPIKRERHDQLVFCLSLPFAYFYPMFEIFCYF
jgi:hypothetical protein